MTTKPCILVIDDEETVRESLAGWLTEDGYEVETAPDGPSGLARLRAKDYAVLLVDLKMPGMDGLEVLSKAREIRQEISVIIMTAYATVGTAVQAMKQGAHDYLMKPFEPEDLSRLVEHLTRERVPGREGVLERDATSRGSGITEPRVEPAAIPPAVPAGLVASGTAAESLREVERKHIVGILTQLGWNISRSARALGIDRVTLYNKIKKYGIREDEQP